MANMTALALCGRVVAQPLSIGVKGGLGLTDAFADQTVQEAGIARMACPGYDPSYSRSKDYIAGAMIELRLPAGLSIEFDALYRPLNITFVHFVAPGNLGSAGSGTMNSWEFPLLAKFRFPTPLVKPYMEMGPSFRSLGTYPITVTFPPNLANKGFTAGAGVEFKLLRLKIGPEVRYTRWGSDTNPQRYLLLAASNVNQGEFLLGLSF